MSIYGNNDILRFKHVELFTITAITVNHYLYRFELLHLAHALSAQKIWLL